MNEAFEGFIAILYLILVLVPAVLTGLWCLLIIAGMIWEVIW